MHYQPSIVAEGAEGFGEKTQVAVPKKLARTNLQIGVQINLQSQAPISREGARPLKPSPTTSGSLKKVKLARVGGQEFIFPYNGFLAKEKQRSRLTP